MLNNNEQQVSKLWRDMEERNRRASEVRNGEILWYLDSCKEELFAAGIALVLALFPIWVTGALLGLSLAVIATRYIQVKDICGQGYTKGMAPQWGEWTDAIEELKRRLRKPVIAAKGVFFLAMVHVVPTVLTTGLNYWFDRALEIDLLSASLWAAYAGVGAVLAYGVPPKLKNMLVETRREWC